jgi:murein DD-endopeptidase MepM/ murein hydrolase activator NlpD
MPIRRLHRLTHSRSATNLQPASCLNEHPVTTQQENMGPHTGAGYRRGPASSARSLHVRWLLTGLALPLAGGALAFAFFRSGEPSVPPTTATLEFFDVSALALPKLQIPETANNPAFTPMGDTVEFVVRRNDTLDRMFRQLELSLQDLAAIRDLPGVRDSLDLLKPGELITLVHADGLVQALTRRISDTQTLKVTRKPSGFAAAVIDTPIELRTVQKRGRIDSSLFVAGRSVGVSSDVIMRLANDIFGWDIDFALEIQPGDEFGIVYEQRYREGEYLGDGRILAAEFVNSGHTYRAVRYESADGEVAGYFTPSGDSMRKQFLRAPVDFTRISSNFNPRRLHPILNTIRAHKGVDYAAPTGTIIRAAGDGRVSLAGVQGGYGKVVILEHGGGVTTLYGHMTGFAKGIRNGTKVAQGQTIGFVGKTGAATGPHLHYEYRVNGMHKDPRTVPLPEAHPIPAAYLADFRSRAGEMLADLDRARDAAIAVSARVP